MNTNNNRRNRSSVVEEVRYPDSLKTDDRGMVRLSDLNPNDTVVIQGRKIKASMIPLSNYVLECEHRGQGIAVSEGRAFYCEVCKDTKFVVKARS